MFVASSGLYSLNTHFYVCSLIQPASLFYTHFITLVFRVVFEILSVFSPSFDARFVVSELYLYGLLALDKSGYHVNGTVFR